MVLKLLGLYVELYEYVYVEVHAYVYVYEYIADNK